MGRPSQRRPPTYEERKGANRVAWPGHPQRGRREEKEARSHEKCSLWDGRRGRILSHLTLPTTGQSGMMGQGPMDQPGGMRNPPRAPSGMMGSGTMGMMEGGGMGGHMGMMEPGPMLRMLKTELALSEGQEKQLKDIVYQAAKTGIKQRAEVRVAELELQQLLDADPVDMGKVEAKLKDIEGLRTAPAQPHQGSMSRPRGALARTASEIRGHPCVRLAAGHDGRGRAWAGWG